MVKTITKFYKRFHKIAGGTFTTEFVLSKDCVFGIPLRHTRKKWEFSKREEVRLSYRPKDKDWLKIGDTCFRFDYIYKSMHILRRRKIVSMGMARVRSDQQEFILVVENNGKIIMIAPAIDVSNGTIINFKSVFNKVPDVFAVEVLKCAIDDK